MESSLPCIFIARTHLFARKGANSGIGFEIAKFLVAQGATVTIACRNAQRCFAAADRLRKESSIRGAASKNGTISPLIMDVSDLNSVQKAAKTWLQNNDNNHNEASKLDMLFLNAGIFYELNKDVEAPKTLPLSKDGIENVFATNVVGHHLLYRLLEPALLKSSMARVVSTSSVAGIGWLPPYGLKYRFGDTSPMIPATLAELNAGTSSSRFAFALYGRSKLAQAAWSKALTKRLRDNNISSIYINSAHPGAVYTPLSGGKYFPKWWPKFVLKSLQHMEEQLLWSSDEGALTNLYLGVATDDIRNRDICGKYYHPQSIEYDHPYAGDRVLQENVWHLCEESVEAFL